jgi:DNA-binding NarL/FixJ family response regulator
VSTETKRARIVLVEDHPIVREGIAQLINRQSDLMVAGEAGDAHTALRVIKKTRPDVAIVDLSLGAESGLELIKTLMAEHPDLAVLVLSMHDEEVFAERALRAGALGYVTKQEATDVLLAAVRQVLRGDVWVSSRASKMLVERLVVRRKTPSEGTARLSDRELDVLALLGAGVGTREIALRLRISVKTVESHRAHIKEKLGIQSATQLVAFAARWAGAPSRIHRDEPS